MSLKTKFWKEKLFRDPQTEIEVETEMDAERKRHRNKEWERKGERETEVRALEKRKKVCGLNVFFQQQWSF